MELLRCAGLSVRIGGQGHAGRARIAGDERRSGGRCLCHRRELSAPTGVIPDNLATNEALLEIIVGMFDRGEYNKIRLANKAIAKFEAAELG